MVPETRDVPHRAVCGQRGRGAGGSAAGSASLGLCPQKRGTFQPPPAVQLGPGHGHRQRPPQGQHAGSPPPRPAGKMGRMGWQVRPETGVQLPPSLLEHAWASAVSICTGFHRPIRRAAWDLGASEDRDAKSQGNPPAGPAPCQGVTSAPPWEGWQVWAGPGGLELSRCPQLGTPCCWGRGGTSKGQRSQSEELERIPSSINKTCWVTSHRAQ